MSWRWVYLLLRGATLGDLLHSRARRLLLWRDTAAACDLTVVGVTSVWTRRLKLTARSGPIEVRIEGTPENLGTRIVVVVPGPPDFGSVKIRREIGRPGAREIEIGDEVFDRTFSIEGPMRLVCALLDKEARRLLLRMNTKSRVEIAGGELWAETFDRQVPVVLPRLLDLGRRFAQKTDIVRCLAENARRDAEPGVRLRNLLLLIRECAWGPWTAKALRTARSDPSPQIRLRAGMALGAEGRDVLVGLAKGKKDDECSAQALRIVGRELPFESTRGILARALRGRRMQTAHACLEELGRSGAAEAVIVLAKVMAQEEGELATAAAQALGDTGSAAAEPPLILALGRDVPNLRVAAAKALGRIGSAAAVQPLEEASERYAHELEFFWAARKAIAEIQARLPNASPGQLSLAGAEGGQLSLAQAESGQLSLATDVGGELSLPSEEAGQLSLGEEEEENTTGGAGP